jgi:glutaredoxin
MIYHIYSKHNCQYCTRAKALLTSKGLEFRELILGEDFTKDDLLSWFPNAKTFPQIEVYNEGTPTYIGGFMELNESLK